MTQEFHISVTPVGEDEYLVRTEQVAPGVPLAEEQVIWPVKDWLNQARQLMNDPLLGMLQIQERAATDIVAAAGNRADQTLPIRSTGAGPFSDPSRAGGMPSLAALGQQLYGALFHGTLRDSWVTAQGIAKHQRTLLRLRLGLKGGRLPRLPWEVLHADDRPLATGADVAFSRYQLGTGLLGQLPAPKQPLRILIAIAAPTDQANLELKQEALHLQEELQSLSSNGVEGNGTWPAVELTILEQPGREQLTQALEQGQYQVLHYAGHSNVGPAGGNLYLVSGKTGLTEMLSGNDLAGLLVNNGIQMAVFNSCRGAYTAASDAADGQGERSLVEALVKRGIPAVLAMAERIPDEVALTLTRLFYRNLKQGYPVDLSLSRARQGLISAYGSSQLYWALPILYLHPEFDGYLVAGRSQERALFYPYGADVAFATSAPVPLGVSGSQTSSVPDETWQTNGTSAAAIAAESVFPANAFEPNPLDEADLEALASDLESDLDSEDADLVADMIRQLSTAESDADDPIIPASGSENLLPDAIRAEAAALAMYQDLPDNPSYTNTSAKHSGVPPQARDSLAVTSHGPGSDLVQTATQLVTNPLLVEGTNATPAPLTGSSNDNPLQENDYQRRQGWRRLGLAGATAIALLGVWFFRDRLVIAPPPNTLPVPPVEAADQRFSPDKLKGKSTKAVTAEAIAHFKRGDLPRGQQAVEVLLDRNVLVAADTALNAVPTKQINQPAIQFLQGRLAWQFVQIGNEMYSVDDARRSWERAVKQQPNSIAYQNALGFAYYAEGKWEWSKRVWRGVLKQDAEAVSDNSAKPASTNMPTTSNRKDILTAYAGLALVLTKSAQGQLSSQEANLVKSLHQTVLAESSDDFQTAALNQNWLWTEQAIRDWELILLPQLER